MNKGIYIYLILIDLQKVFDTFDHLLRLQNLEYIDFYVPLEDVFSDAWQTNFGVPQATILQSSLFLIFINNLP